MSKDVAVIGDTGVVIAINVHMDDYELAPNEALVTNSAWVGGTFDSGYFYPPQPYPSWFKDGVGGWDAPVSMPEEGLWIWNEEQQQWQEIND